MTDQMLVGLVVLSLTAVAVLAILSMSLWISSLFFSGAEVDEWFDGPPITGYSDPGAPRRLDGSVR